MSEDRPDIPRSGDPYARIEELEHQVRELSSLVERMIDRQVHPPDDDPPPDIDDPDQLELPHSPLQLDLSTLIESFGQRLGQALGGEEGESLESRIGGIWLSKIAAILIMTVVALGFALTLRDAPLDAWQKIAAGYGLAAFGVLFGVLSKRRDDVLAQMLLGCGLAAAFFTTYAAVFLTQTQLIRDWRLGLAALGAAFLVTVGTIYRQRSRGAASVALLLVAYTIVLSMRSDPSLARLLYALGACAALALAAAALHRRHGWLSFAWATLLTTYLVYLFFLRAKPPAVDLSDLAYFWASIATLCFLYVVFAAAFVADARRTGSYRRTVGAAVTLNSLVFVGLAGPPVAAFYPEQQWVFRAVFFAMLLILAIASNRIGPRLNPVFQLFAVKAALVLALWVQAALTKEWFVLALAVECFGLAAFYRRTGLVAFKVLGLAVLVLTFAGALSSVRSTAEIDLGYWTVPGNWFVCIGAPLILTAVAGFYEHFVRRLPPGRRTAQGQSVLADGWLDIRNTAAAMCHASAAALILMTITIIDQGESPALPFILAGESVAFVVWGLILRTPQIDVAGVLLLAASHVAYHAFLFMQQEGFVTHAYFVELTSGIALLTYIGGFLWERYLSRIVGGSDLEHDLLAGIPYLASTLMLVTLATKELAPQYAAVALNCLAVLLMLASAVTNLTGVRAAGVLAMAMGTALFYTEMYNFTGPLAMEPHFLASLAAMLTTFLATERLVLLWGRGQTEVHDSTPDFVRSLVVTIGGLLGVLGLWEWAPPNRLSLFLLGLSMLAMLCGVLFGESRYRWIAIAVYLIALLRAYAYDLTSLAPLYRFLSFAGLCVPLLLMSWGYSRYRAYSLRQLHLRHESRSSYGHET